MGIERPEIYLYFDGDDVGAKIELLLLSNEVESAAAVSRHVVLAVGNLADALCSRFDARIIFAAGDEVLAIAGESPSPEEVDALRNSFFVETGLTISCGVAPTAQESAAQLRLAKLRGKNRTAGVLFP